MGFVDRWSGDGGRVEEALRDGTTKVQQAGESGLWTKFRSGRAERYVAVAVGRARDGVKEAGELRDF